MATYNTLKYGSKGDEVKKLQTSLGFTGKDVDGIFGDKTLSAVKDYQKNNGLTVDGIVGKNTWGSLNKASTTAPSTTTPTPTATPTAPTVKTSDATNTALNTVKDLEAQKPGKFNYDIPQSSWQNQVSETLNKILNREEFSYDLNGDALYQQYKDQYTTQGQMAMMDTMGQAQAMTGGYGNSYAQSVGQQTYQGYLQQLNDKVPELYQLALSQYNQEGQDLKDLYSLYTDMDDREYGRNMDKINLDYAAHRDEVTDWQNAIDRADSNYWNNYGYDYKLGRDAVTDADTAKKYAYETAMNMLSLGVTPSAEMLASAGLSSADASAIANKVKGNEKKAASSGGGGGGNNNSGNTPKALSVDDHDKVIAQLQAYHDVGDNTKLAGYLDSLVAAGTISEQYADTLYETYYAKVAGPNQMPTTYKLDPNYGKKVTR